MSEGEGGNVKPGLNPASRAAERLPEVTLPWPLAKLPRTPFYFYSEERLKALYAAFKKSSEGSGVHLHYAMKANSHPNVLGFFRGQGAGVDLVSGGEYEIAKSCGFKAKDAIFSGVGKSREELQLAVESGISLVIVESRAELKTLLEIAEARKRAVAIALRVNPDVDAGTHPYITTGLFENKFGVDFNEARDLYFLAHRNPCARLVGISVHIGSQMLDLSALKSALDKTLAFTDALKTAGITLSVLDVGGGLGVPYNEPHKMPPFAEYGMLLRDVSTHWRAQQGEDAKIYCEVGRALVAQAGFLVTRVIRTKQSALKNFVIVDASMTELLRPALYQAQHPISFWAAGDGRSFSQEQAYPSLHQRVQKIYDVVGPVCESADFLGRDRLLPELFEGDVLRIDCAGAYGAVMASRYNGRPLPEEFWV